MNERQKKAKLVLIVVGAIFVLKFGIGIGETLLVKMQTARDKAARAEAEVARVKRDLREGVDARKAALAEELAKLENEIPATVSQSAIFGYFVREFKDKHAKAQFDSVFPSEPSATGIKADPEVPSARVRSSILRIHGSLPQELLMPYLEHIEGYPRSSRLTDLHLAGNRDDTGSQRVKVELTVNLFLAPIEWKQKPSANTPARTTASAGTGPSRWFETTELDKDSDPKGKDGKGAKDKKAKKKSNRKFKVEKVVGNFVVIDAEIYEKGDLIEGWRVTRIDLERKKVTLTQGKETRELKWR